MRLNLSVDFRLVRRLSDSIAAALAGVHRFAPSKARARGGGDVGWCSQELRPIDRWPLPPVWRRPINRRRRNPRPNRVSSSPETIGWSVKMDGDVKKG
ncbi:hypothetical protein NL676_018720, partial [Syzygium grande]